MGANVLGPAAVRSNLLWSIILRVTIFQMVEAMNAVEWSSRIIHKLGPMPAKAQKTFLES